MTSIKFPKIFNASTTSTNVWKESEYIKATAQNTRLALKTMRGELFGDPYFGLMLKKYLFDQNNYILRDAIIDMIYTQLALFIPQLYVRRSDISIIQDKRRGELICEFTATNQIDYEINTFSLTLFEDAE